MESRDNVRERIEALEQRTEHLQQHIRTVEQRLRWWRGIASGVLLLSLVSLAHPGHATDFACAAGDVACLIDAINQANANGEANTITLDVGVYTLGAVDNDTDGPNGLPSITSALTIRGAGVNSTIIERGLVFGVPPSPLPNFRIVHIATVGTLTLTGVTVRGGLLTTQGNPGGAGILNLGSLTLTHGIIADNMLQLGGPLSAGGVVNKGTLTMRASIITRNSGSGATALFESSVSGGLSNTGTATLTHCMIAGNTASPSRLGATTFGGALNTGMLTLIASFITDNAASGGLLGATGIGGMGNSGQLSVLTTTIAANSGQGDTGIGGFSNNGGTVTLTQSTIAANRGAGGFTSIGGGESSRGQLTMLNSTIAGNIALGGGADESIGGLLNVGTLTLLNSTIADNAARGGSIQVGGINSGGGTVTLQNTLLARNTTTPNPPVFPPGRPDCAGSVTSLGNNLIGDPTGCAITLQPTDLTGDPGLATFRDNGRPGNGHFPLLPTSQAIDAGNDAVCPRTDQLGQRRIGRCDIGAIRFLDGIDLLQEDTPAATQASQ